MPVGSRALSAVPVRPKRAAPAKGAGPGSARRRGDAARPIRAGGGRGPAGLAPPPRGFWRAAVRPLPGGALRSAHAASLKRSSWGHSRHAEPQG